MVNPNKVITSQNKRIYATSRDPMRCTRCNNLYGTADSFRDHIIECMRVETQSRAGANSSTAKHGNAIYRQQPDPLVIPNE